MIRALIFDFDGLILDTETPEFQSWQEVYQQFGCELPFDRWVNSIGLGWGEYDPYGSLEALVGHAVDRDAIRTVRRARNYELLLEQPVQAGVVDYLEMARQMGLSVGIASSSPRSWIIPHLERIGLADYFPHIRCADDVQRAKPDPEVYQAALSMFGLHAHEAIALEDSSHGVAAAVASGIYCVAVPNLLTAHMPFTDAHLRLPSLAEMPLAEVVRLADEHVFKKGCHDVPLPANP